MKKKLDYSFDDEIVSKFCYDMDNKQIDIHFTGYSNEYERFLDKPCVLSISKWSDAKIKIEPHNKLHMLDNYIGIFSMILYIKCYDDIFEMLVNTIDNRYITIYFIQANVNFTIK